MPTGSSVMADVAFEAKTPAPAEDPLDRVGLRSKLFKSSQCCKRL